MMTALSDLRTRTFLALFFVLALLLLIALLVTAGSQIHPLASIMHPDIAIPWL